MVLAAHLPDPILTIILEKSGDPAGTETVSSQCGVKDVTR